MILLPTKKIFEWSKVVFFYHIVLGYSLYDDITNLNLELKIRVSFKGVLWFF
jgi:hypothetical protein